MFPTVYYDLFSLDSTIVALIWRILVATIGSHLLNSYAILPARYQLYHTLKSNATRLLRYTSDLYSSKPPSDLSFVQLSSSPAVWLVFYDTVNPAISHLSMFATLGDAIMAMAASLLTPGKCWVILPLTHINHPSMTYCILIHVGLSIPNGATCYPGLILWIPFAQAEFYNSTLLFVS